MDKYYREQLQLLREGAAVFARQYPAIAPMLLESGADPDVERILEGTAWLCGKIHERLDQTAPDLVQSLLRLVFPQAILPVPSTTLVRFTPQPGFAEALDAPRGSQLASNPVDGVPCIYATTHDLRILPLAVAAVRHEATGGSAAKVTLALSAHAPLQKFLPSSLVLHLSGGYAAASDRLLALLTRLDHVEIACGAQRAVLPASAVSRHPLPLDDLRLPAGRRSHRAYMELIRYFHFPEQLLQVRVSGLDRLAPGESAAELAIEFFFKGGTQPLPVFDEHSFTLNVAAAENVFKVTAEPLVVDHTREEYLIRPQDGERRFLEILGVDRVTALLPGGRMERCIPYEAYDAQTKGILYSLRHRPTEKPGLSEHLLTPLYRPEAGREELDRYTLSLELLCCNHSLPASLRAGDICRPTDTSPSQASFTNITAPSPMLPRPENESLRWRFLSHLNTNLLALASPAALRSLLELYLPERSAAPELSAADARRCQAVREFSSREEERLFRGRLLRGRELRLSLDPAGFVSRGDLHLFAGALDRFFTEFTNLNTYSRLSLDIAGTGETHQWPPRLGEKQLI